MGKKVIIVPPQSVNVSVNVNVGQQVPQQQVPQQQGTQVNTAVHVGAAWPVVAPAPSGPYTPPFDMPTSDVLRRTIPKLARLDQQRAQAELGLGDHVHTPQCAESGCSLLTAHLPHKVSLRPWAMFGWLLVAACVWVVQYSLIVPLAWLGAVAKSGGAKAAGWFAILLCGFGPFYALYYLCSPAVPKNALTPWGLSSKASPTP